MANQQAFAALARMRVGMVMVYASFAVCGGIICADDVAKWKTGPDLTKALRATIGYTWSERPLQEGLTALSRDTGVAIFLDRRIDPDQHVNSSVRDVALSDAIKELAGSLDLSVGMIGSAVYIGPGGSAGRIQGLATLRRSDAAAVASRSKWLTPKKTSWEELSEPRKLAETFAAGAGAKIANPSAIPHDLWAAWSGPPMTPLDQLTLVLVGFDLTFELGGEGAIVNIVPAPESLVYEHSYSVTGSLAAVASDLKRILPEIKVQPGGREQIRVTGTAEEHAKVADLLAGKPAKTKAVVKPGEKRYTFTAQNELVGSILKTIANAAGLEVKAETAIVEKLKQRVTVEAKDLSLEDALKKVLDPVGITFKLEEKTLELGEKSEER